ncbi:hypothetical protein PMI11_05559 [Rhizobium sp. CF142]|nr:hypothetical protein PMI11_05559 [Rhizobium sp. CF142]
MAMRMPVIPGPLMQKTRPEAIPPGFPRAKGGWLGLSRLYVVKLR